MSNSETVYTSQQAADKLGITQQMLSKYTQAYLQLSGDKILKQGRNGRRYSEVQFKMIQNARNWVQSNTGITVQDAMKRAVAFSDSPLEVIEGIQAGNDLVAFRTALREEVAGPIVEKLEALQRELEALKASNANTRVFSEADIKPSEPVHRQYSPLVRLFRKWLHID